MKKRWGRLVIALCLFMPILSYAQPFLPESSVKVIIKQMGVNISAAFKQYQADFKLDPQQLSKSYLKMVVQVNSYDMGEPSYNEQVKGATWLDAQRYPQATFVSNQVTLDSSKKALTFLVQGTLTIKGKSQKITIPVTVSKQANRVEYSGSFVIQRNKFDVGTGAWKDTSVVADAVEIIFDLKTK